MSNLNNYTMLAGGFLFLVANGPGTIALDARKKA